MEGFDIPLVNWDRLGAVVAHHVEAREVPGVVMAVSHGDEVQTRTVGTGAFDINVPLAADSVMRISSMTKPLMAALTLTLVRDGTLAVHDPVERWVPELASRRVLRHLDGPVDDTVPAKRPITIDDLLTLRMGFGFVVDSPCPVLELAAQAGLGFGPPDPSIAITPDEWVTQFAKLPLMHQPGEDWMYEFGYGLLGVVLARAAHEPLEELLRDRLLDPLGMADTAFAVPERALSRLIPCYSRDEQGVLTMFDGAEHSRWANHPTFPDGRGGLVSTALDYLRFARMLLTGGIHDGTRVLPEELVRSMTSDQLGQERAHAKSADFFLSIGGGWGYGLEVITPVHTPGARTKRYGWGGGLGTTWYSFPDRDVSAVLFTQCVPAAEQLITAFWSALHQMLDA